MIRTLAMLKGHDIVCISSIDWDFIWQGHQQIMAALAANGNRVLFIENTGVRSPRLQDLPRLRHRIVRWWRSTRGFREERPNLYVFSPLVLPLPYSRVARMVNRTVMVRAIRRWARVMGFSRPIVWTFLPTPLARDLLVALDPEASVYYCIDDLSSSSAQARRVEASERKLFGEVDLVFVTSERLRQRAAAYTRRVHLFPFAVDYPKFEAAREADLPVPDDLARLPRPWIGYLGGIHRWVDQGIVVELARRLPEVSLALIGPVQTDVSALAACPNVHLLGAKPHAEVPRYLKRLDVAIVPYRLTEYTAHVYPTKLNEYLAMGLPVVATDLPEIRRFNDDHGGIVTVARDVEHFVSSTRAALANSSVAEVERRLAVARRNSWEARIEEMSGLLEERLHERSRLKGVRWEETLQRLYRVNRRRVGRLAVAAALAYVALFWSPLPWIVAEPLRLEQAAAPADAIVVFAGGVGESGQPQGYQERVQRAVELYQGGYAQRMIFSTGWVYTFHEADVMKALAESLGVPPAAIILEKRAASTHENVAFVAPLLEHVGRRVLLVSSPYHMRRAVLTFRKVAPDFEVVPTPSRSHFYRHRWDATLPQLRAIAHEYLAIGYYWWKGWV